MENHKPEAQVYSREQYATKQFWDSRYKEKQSYFDWYAQFPQLKETFEQQYGLAPSQSILMLGCGNSKLSQQMYEEGYHNILNIDISPAVIEQMKKISLQKGQTQMKWEVMDATSMSEIKDNSFDAIIDKGTLDALISGKNLDICAKMLIQSMRVLKQDGQFILVTYGSPEGRKKLFDISIGLKDYDYYATKVDLSSMSTLINLMRSNLGNKPLSSITKDTQAMKKSLLQFNLLKVLRRTRKNEKKYIVWPHYEKKEVLFNENEQNHVTGQVTKTQQTQTVKQQKQNNKQKQEPVTEQQVKKEQKKEQKVNYNPKKQSFCYVYSIRPKFGIDLQKVVSEIDGGKQSSFGINENGDKQVPGDGSLTKIGIYPQECQQEVERALKYLSAKKIANNPTVIYSSAYNYKKAKDQLKVVLAVGKQNVVPALAKSIYEIAVKCEGNKVHDLERAVQSACRMLVEHGELAVHPTPRQYAYLGILMQKLQTKIRFADFIAKQWYPTYRLISYSSGSAVYRVSAPPTLKQDYSIRILSQAVGSNALSVQQIKKGYLNYYDPKLISLVSLCTLTYCEGQTSNLVVQQFQSNFNSYASEQATLYLKKQAIPLIMARLLSAL